MCVVIGNGLLPNLYVSTSSAYRHLLSWMRLQIFLEMLTRAISKKKNRRYSRKAEKNKPLGFLKGIYS